jgi:AhpD family alkylhydroperoxidase
MQARMKPIVQVIPESMTALQALAAAAEKGGVAPVTFKLIELRASQINGCSVCVDMHARQLARAGEASERINTVAAWRDTPYFTPAERAALALTEALTRCDVPDDVWEEAARHYDERQLAALVVDIATINAWNRLNIATRQVSGDWTAAY